ncbi:conserved hypothetical protein [Theileria orientalis strain Shintoku]|uniref:Uncharacterized protein n=1 Tax=Theileria orientalis strain Shintoku TaxID=869250 RepID=J4DAM0_THEOR|nr:conserved hypothetical protein [Theileria orientalis strain Shintoku]BAM42070.1 conserved hypothetical protein [Theileria orientalis strain Shintoku]|eukprot:XP_009692371.1 conserved hypothetical protein [Theileria orientalis strain Shintoku]
MLEIPDQPTNKYFKVLYGPLNHAFHITLHNKPYKNIVLFDDNFRQIRKIDVSQVSSFQSRCVQSDSTVNVLNRKQSIVTKQHLIEIYFASTNKHPLTFTTVSYADCQLLSEEIEKVFGVRVYNYGTLNTAFKNALRNVGEAEQVTEDYDRFQRNLDSYQFHRNAYELKSLYDFAQLDYNEHTEPLAEISSNFPVVIEGNLEDGSFVSYRDILTRNNLNTSVYKVEWYLSKSVGSSEEYFETASETADTFYISEYMIGHFVMVKVYRALKFNENRTFVFSTAQKGPIYPSSLLCHHILINSTKKPDLHETLISTLDLDVLFNVVDKSHKFGMYEQFNNNQIVSNFAEYQKYLENNVNNNTENASDDNSANNSKENDSTINADADLNASVGFDNSDENNNTNSDTNNPKNSTDSSKNNENEIVQPRKFNHNSIKLKVPSKMYDSEEDDEQLEEGEGERVVGLNKFDEKNAESLKFLYGEGYKKEKESNYKDLHETTTVSELSSSDNVGFDVEEIFREEPRRRRFSIFSIFKPKKKNSPAARPLNPKDFKENHKAEKKMMQDKVRPGKNTGRFKDMNTKREMMNKKESSMANKNVSNNAKRPPSEEESQQVALEVVKDMIEESETNKVVKESTYEDEEALNMNEDKHSEVEEDHDDHDDNENMTEKSPKKMPRNGNQMGKGSGNSNLKANMKMKNKMVKNTVNESKMVEKSPKVGKSQMKNMKPEKGKKGKRVVYNKKYEKQLKQQNASTKKNPKGMSNPNTLSEHSEPENDYTSEQEYEEYNDGKSRNNVQNNVNRNNMTSRSEKKMPKQMKQNKKKGSGGLFGLFKRIVEQPKNVEVQSNQDNEVDDALKQAVIKEQRLKRFMETVKFVPVELKICLNELVIRYGPSSLSLKWKVIEVEKADELVFDQFPSMQKQLENKLTLIYKSTIPIRIGLRTQSTFQRNVLYHSILFNKYRPNYSIDRCERELENCYYNGVRMAYTKACRALYEHKKRNEVTDLKEAAEAPKQMQLNIYVYTVQEQMKTN